MEIVFMDMILVDIQDFHYTWGYNEDIMEL